MTSEFTPYIDYVASASETLQQWYDPTTGLWQTTDWWNAANALGALIDYMSITHTNAYLNVVANTFDKNKGSNFLNKYYDDEGWWALTWIKAFDLTGDVRYLIMAETIFIDMTGGWDDTCNGGIWWTKDRKYKNAIANELFLAIGAKLYLRSSTQDYLAWAQRDWTWFASSGLINAKHLINDGLNGACANNNGTTWTYNQGVILGGLADLHKITQNPAYLTAAEAVADATITTLASASGILTEPGEPHCDANGAQFKGIFIRNLAYLYLNGGKPAYKAFILKNADSIWQNNRNATNQLGLCWTGPFDTPDAARQTSALDALNAAMLVNISSGKSVADMSSQKNAGL